jgi:hypothetical protein
MTKIFSLMVLAFALGLFAQPVINITGTVTDINGKTLSGANVKLLAPGLFTVTDSVGHFTLVSTKVNAARQNELYRQPYITGGFLNFSVPSDNTPVRIDAFDCTGRLVCSIADGRLPAGEYRIAPFHPGAPAQLYLLRVYIGHASVFFKMPYVRNLAGSTALSIGRGGDFNNFSLLKKSSVIDTLEVSLAGYATEKKPVDSYVGNYYIVLKKGSVSRIFFDKQQYLSMTKATITVVDSDLDATDSYASAAVFSTSDPMGILMILHLVAGQTGTFSGTLNFAQNTVIVSDGDTLTATYFDASPQAFLTAKATWNAMAGRVSVDSASYTGIGNRMTITLDDSDITDSVASVKVTSTKDTAGIIAVLKAVTGIPGKFSGKAGFSITSSSSGIIQVADSNVVTVSYSDAAPKGVRAATAKFYLGWKKGFGIYSNTVTPASMVKTGALPKFGTWGPTSCSVDSAPNFFGTGNTVKVTAGTMGWAGFGWYQTDNSGMLTGINMTEFAACSLHVAFKGNATDLKLLVENINPGSTGPQTWVAASTYGYVADEQWHELIIPLSAWAATCDLSGVSYFMGVSFDPYVTGQYIIVDDLYWTLPN